MSTNLTLMLLEIENASQKIISVYSIINFHNPGLQKASAVG